MFVLLAIFPWMYKWPFFGHFLIEFRTFQATRFAIWLIILMGLNLLTGYSGQISLGHAALIAIGAYVAAILMKDYNTPVFAAVLAAGIVTGVIGFIIGIPALRLSGPYLAIATLALIIVLPQIIKHPFMVDHFHTGGVNGILLQTPHAPTNLGGRVTDDQWLYYCCMLPAIIMTTMAWSLTRSRMGRAFVALRDSEVGAQQMGIHVSLYKMTAFGLCSLFAGVGGALYVYTTPYLGPSTFDILLSLTLMVMIVLGGLASIVGAICAAIIMTMRIDITNWIAGVIPAGDRLGIDQTRGALFGLLLILSIIFTPRGVAGNFEKIKEANIERRRSRQERQGRREEREPAQD
jgi:branched-chain amino acid transport system permease protein